jgi:hypothetical protein
MIIKVHYNGELIDRFVTPGLNNSIENLNLAISLCDNLNVIDDIDSKSDILGLKDFLINEKSLINDVSNKLSFSANIFSNTKVETEKIVASLDQQQMTIRENIVK